MRLLLFLVLAASSSGCIVLVPFIEPDIRDGGAPGQETRVYNPCSMNSARDPSAIDSGQCVHQGGSRGYAERAVRPRRLSSLLTQLQNGNAAARTNAATDLGRLGPAAGEALSPLMKAACCDESKWVRRAAVKSLPRISTNQEVIRTLSTALKDNNKWVAHSAANALKKIGTKEAKKALSGSHG